MPARRFIKYVAQWAINADVVDVVLAGVVVVVVAIAVVVVPESEKELGDPVVVSVVDSVGSSDGSVVDDAMGVVLLEFAIQRYPSGVSVVISLSQVAQRKLLPLTQTSHPGTLQGADIDKHRTCPAAVHATPPQLPTFIPSGSLNIELPS